MVQTTIYLDKDQKKRVDDLPRKVSFSELIRDSFDYIMYDHEHKNKLDIKAV